MTDNSKICGLITAKIPIEGGLYLLEAEYSVKRGSLLLEFATKGEASGRLREQIHEALSDILPPYVKSYVTQLRRIYYDEEVLGKEISDYITKNHAAAAGLLELSGMDFDAPPTGQTELRFNFDPRISEYLKDKRVSAHLSAHLSEKYREEFIISFAERELVSSPGIKAPPPVSPAPLTPSRTIEAGNRAPLIGGEIAGDPGYIEDARPGTGALLCGTVKFFGMRQSQKGKAFAKFTIEDPTGSMPCLHFPAAANVAAAEKLADGTEVLVLGEIKEDERSGLTMFAKEISLCELAPDFKPQPLPSRPEPAEYSVVFPARYESAAQQNLFDEATVTEVSPRLLEADFVAFDLETTGVTFDLDAVVEIAAVKISGGKITETFHGLINPGRPIPASATAVNNITDDMVAGSPPISEVLPDFYKFTRGAELVAHNIEFDIRFLNFNAKQYGYYFDNALSDTLALARERLKGLANYKLETVAAHFGIDPGDKHRALSDALTCAEAFIELLNRYSRLN